MAKMEFAFVNSNMSCPNVPKDVEVRAMIRRQAMKKASAARKLNGNYGQHNLRQYPVFVVHQEYVKTEVTIDFRDGSTESDSDKHMAVVQSEARGRNKTKTHRKTIRASSDITTSGNSNSAKTSAAMLEWMAASVPASPSATGYDLKRMQSDFDLLIISTLATVHTGRAVRAVFSQKPQELILQLRSQQCWTYLTFLPSRYEHSPCLRDATDCVIARIRRTLSPDSISETSVIKIYLKALRTVQAALECPQERTLPEVLCAVEILALYEVFDTRDETAWIRHSAGAAKLIRLRGPENFTTEFEKSLLTAQCITILTEAVITGQKCFLDEAPWRATLQSLVEPSTLISDRSPIVIDLVLLKCQVADYFADCVRIIYSKKKPSIAHINKVISRLRKLRNDFLDWHERYELLIADVQDLTPGTANHDSHSKSMSHYTCSVVGITRLLAALVPLERRELEEATQTLAQRMLKMHKESDGAAATVLMSLSTAVVTSAIATREDWCGDVGAVDEGMMIQKEKLTRWCNMFGKITP